MREAGASKSVELRMTFQKLHTYKIFYVFNAKLTEECIPQHLISVID